MDIKKVFSLCFLLLMPCALVAMEEHAHVPPIFHQVNAEISLGDSSEGNLTDWSIEAWVGGDTHKLVIMHEGEKIEHTTETLEWWALYSYAVDTFWDVQVGLRHDFKPDDLTYGAIGVEGLLPYFIETSVFFLLSDDGDASLEFDFDKDFLLTQKLILQPYLEFDIYFQNVSELDIGRGLSELEAGLNLRYEIIRKIAPFIKLKYERKVGRTSSIAKSAGESPDNLGILAGLRVML